MPITMFRKTATSTPIGLDIGRTTTRCIQLRRAADRWEVSAAATWPNRRSEDHGSHTTNFSERLQQSIRHGEFRRKDVVVGLTPPDVELHALDIPRNNRQDDEIQSAARWEIERLSRYDEGCAQTAQWWLPRGRNTRTTALGVAAPTEMVNRIWKACRDAGTECIAIDVSACAICRAAALLRNPHRDEIWGVLDLGARDGRLMLCVDEVPVLARSLNAGGDEWTTRIADSLKVSSASAEVHKCDHGIMSTRKGVRVDADGCSDVDRSQGLTDLSDMIWAVLRAEVERVAVEIERSYEYVMQCYPERHAADLLLVGAAGGMNDLDRYLTDRLGIPVKAAEAYLGAPESRIAVCGPTNRLREPFGAYLGAVGLSVFEGAGQ